MLGFEFIRVSKRVSRKKEGNYNCAMENITSNDIDPKQSRNRILPMYISVAFAIIKSFLSYICIHKISMYLCFKYCI